MLQQSVDGMASLDARVNHLRRTRGRRRAAARAALAWGAGSLLALWLVVAGVAGAVH